MDIRAYVASRRRLWSFGGLCLGIGLLGLDVYAAIVTYVPQYTVRNDFRLMYGAALAAQRHGYSHLYDLSAQQAAVHGLGAGFYYSPFINPPPLAWLVTPLTALPFGAALVVWSGVLVAALAFAWFLAAPGDRQARVALGATWLGLFPVAFGLMVGQPVALVAAAVAACWWLASRGRPWVAGLSLSLIVVKPQLALLVPLCLLVAGQTRVFIAWLVPSAIIGVVALALLGADGVARYRDVLTIASGWQITRSYAVSGLVGTGPQLYAASAVAVAAAVVAAWRWRHAGLEIPIAAGIVGSLLFTPYVGFQDFAMLVVAGWLVLRARPVAWQVGLLVVGYALLELALVVLALPILLAEVLLLASFIYWAPAPASDSARLAPNVPIEAPSSAPLAPNVPN